MNYNQQFELIDLSQEIYQGMPVFGMHQNTFFITTTFIADTFYIQIMDK